MTVGQEDLCYSSLIANPGGAKTGAQLYWSASPTGGVGAVLWQPRFLLCAVKGRAELLLRHQQDSTGRFWPNPLCCETVCSK